MAAMQAKQPDMLTSVPRHEWPVYHSDRAEVLNVWRSKKFLVVLYVEYGIREFRMTVNRASIDSKGKWNAEITWDELQKIKREIGYGNRWAVECYPPESDVVNVANMRHLWLLESPPNFGWKKS